MRVCVSVCVFLKGAQRSFGEEIVIIRERSSLTDSFMPKQTK